MRKPTKTSENLKIVKGVNIRTEKNFLCQVGITSTENCNCLIVKGKKVSNKKQKSFLNHQKFFKKTFFNASTLPNNQNNFLFQENKMHNKVDSLNLCDNSWGIAAGVFLHLRNLQGDVDKRFEHVSGGA